MMPYKRRSFWWRLAVYPPCFAIALTIAAALGTAWAVVDIGQNPGSTVYPDYLAAAKDGVPRGLFWGIACAVIQSWRKSEWRGEPGNAGASTVWRWALLIPQEVARLLISRPVAASFGALLLGLNAWMFRYSVTPTGSRLGAAFITDRWKGQTYLCEPAGCRPLILSKEQAAEAQQQSTRENQPPREGAWTFYAKQQQLVTQAAATGWKLEPVQGDPFAIASQQTPPNPMPAASQQNSLPPGLNPPPQPPRAQSSVNDWVTVGKPQQPATRPLATAPIEHGSNQTASSKSGKAVQWAQFPLVLPSSVPSGAASTSVQSGQVWVQVPAREFLVTDPAKQNFIVNAPAGADKYFVINITRDGIGRLSQAARASLLPIEAGKTYDDWVVTPLHP